MLSKLRTELGPILSIKFDEERGLELAWNLTGINTPTVEHYHIFAFIGLNTEDAQTFFKGYCSDLKNGELIGIFVPRIANILAKPKVNWTEKSGFNSEGSLFHKSNFITNIYKEFLDELTTGIQAKRGLIMVNIFCDLTELADHNVVEINKLLENYLTTMRQQNLEGDKIIFNLVCPQIENSKVDSSNALNHIHYDKLNPSTSWKSIRALSKLTVLKSLKITIVGKNKLNILSCSCNEWNLTEKSELWKKYYALPRLQFVEYLVFGQSGLEKDLNIQLGINISFTYFDGSQTRCQKDVTFHSDFPRMAVRTVDPGQAYGFNIHEFSKGVYLQTNLIGKQNNILVGHVDGKERKATNWEFDEEI